ncbi:PilW family protein [Neisseria yangbaofengii]|uniref:PilW family protein n=1 Tax=Neisseria yangbaofengii TaxID=2709396 RepID=UPI00197D9C48|nr:prepilin-type N-terminal cleavage/methylation domain-containing protein [Neisseria yangbaofengii]
MKNKRSTFARPPKMQGFSLIEFLVASALSMIVLMAVTSTYFTARNLNNAATSRLSVQQDLRGAATLLSRDARMAGSFGCFNMADYTDNTVITDDSNASFTLRSNIVNGKMVPITEGEVNYPGFSPLSKNNALIFQYGIDATGSNANVASSCNKIAKSAGITDLTTAKSALKITGDETNGAISMLQHVVSAYAVGSFNNQAGLYRFQLNHETGNWGDPQLLMKDVQSMNINYFYIDNTDDCRNLAASTTSQETFTRKDTLRTNTAASTDGTTPALIQIQLGTDNATAYNIEASVRGGNVCANHAI